MRGIVLRVNAWMNDSGHAIVAHKRLLAIRSNVILPAAAPERGLIDAQDLGRILERLGGCQHAPYRRLKQDLGLIQSTDLSSVSSCGRRLARWAGRTSFFLYFPRITL